MSLKCDIWHSTAKISSVQKFRVLAEISVTFTSDGALFRKMLKNCIFSKTRNQNFFMCQLCANTLSFVDSDNGSIKMLQNQFEAHWTFLEEVRTMSSQIFPQNTNIFVFEIENQPKSLCKLDFSVKIVKIVGKKRNIFQKMYVPTPWGKMSEMSYLMSDAKTIGATGILDFGRNFCHFHFQRSIFPKNIGKFSHKNPQKKMKNSPNHSENEKNVRKIGFFKNSRCSKTCQK